MQTNIGQKHSPAESERQNTNTAKKKREKLLQRGKRTVDVA